ncbi:MAG TPA: hypothetical protein VKE92_07610 [Anaerolineales bacterium]|nr:hypothetical protein [Anaerolineales bacterium]
MSLRTYNAKHTPDNKRLLRYIRFVFAWLALALLSAMILTQRRDDF